MLTFATIVTFIVTFIIMGFEMTALHAFVHRGGLRKKDCPHTVKLYGWPHMDHHKEIHNHVEHTEKAPSFFDYILQRGIKDICWVVKNLATHDRWTPVRLLIMMQSLALMIVLNIFFSTTIAILIATSFATGCFALMFCYDIWHLWTHINGPFGGSKYHAYHHGRPQEDFGMWFWNQIKHPQKSLWVKITILQIKIFEKLLSKISPNWEQETITRVNLVLPQKER